jgi:hypothetical protein
MATPLATLLTVASLELQLAIFSSIKANVVVIVVVVIVFARTVGGRFAAILQTHVVLAIWEKFLIGKRRRALSAVLVTSIVIVQSIVSGCLDGKSSLGTFSDIN